MPTDDLKSKSLGDLVGEMIAIIVDDPSVLSPDRHGRKRFIYLSYKEELSRREQELYFKNDLAKRISDLELFNPTMNY